MSERQDWTAQDQRMYASIVHNLRTQGWSNYDAMEEADIKMSRVIERRLATDTPDPSHTADYDQLPASQKEDRS